VNPRHKPLLLAAGAIGVGLALVFAFKGRAPATAATPAAAMPETTAPATAPAAGAATAASAGEAFPWEQSTPPAAATAPAPVQAPAMAETGSARMDARSLATMQQQVQQSQQAADTLLHKLDEMQGSGKQPEDVNLDALRTNVLLAKRAQTLALEMVMLNQQPASAERDGRVQAITHELLQLRGQLRTDVNRAAPATVAR